MRPRMPAGNIAWPASSQSSAPANASGSPSHASAKSTEAIRNASAGDDATSIVRSRRRRDRVQELVFWKRCFSFRQKVFNIATILAVNHVMIGYLSRSHTPNPVSGMPEQDENSANSPCRGRDAA